MPTKVYLVKPMVFPVAMYGCESWTVKKSEHRTIDAFELHYWRRRLRAPWTARRSNLSILKEITTGGSLEGLMLKLNSNILATWCEELTHWKRPRCWERLKAGGEGDDRGCDGWMASSTQWTWVWVNSESWWWTGRAGVPQFMWSQRVGHDGATELNWRIHFVFIRSVCKKDFPGGWNLKESDCNAGNTGSIPGKGRSPGEGNCYPLRYSCLENSMDRGAWRAIVHGITKSQTRLRD